VRKGRILQVFPAVAIKLVASEVANGNAHDEEIIEKVGRVLGCPEM
jgi:hypothetical protein